MDRSWRTLLKFYTGGLIALLSLLHTNAWAGPGGLIKAAVMTPMGRIGLFVLAVIFAPLIAYFLIKERIQIRRTQADLVKLAAVYPQYRWLDIQDRASAAFQWVWSAWGREKMEIASDFTTSWYMQNQQMLLDDWEARGLHNVCRVQEFRRCEPLFVQHNEANGGEGSRLVLAMYGSGIDYLEERATGAVVQGDKTGGVVSAVWTFLWQDGSWRLNQIQPLSSVWEYLAMPNELPATLQAQAARS